MGTGMGWGGEMEGEGGTEMEWDGRWDIAYDSTGRGLLRHKAK